MHYETVVYLRKAKNLETEFYAIFVKLRTNKKLQVFVQICNFGSCYNINAFSYLTHFNGIQNVLKQ